MPASRRVRSFRCWARSTRSRTSGRTQAPDSVYGSTLTILSKYRILRFGHRADAFVFGLGRRDCGRGHRAGFQQPPALDGHQRFGQPVHHQPSVSLGHGARDQNPQYRDPFARNSVLPGRAGRQHRAGRGVRRARGGSSAAISTIRPCRMSTARWRGGLRDAFREVRVGLFRIRSAVSTTCCASTTC